MSQHAIVIGGGIIGLATSFEFQEAGFEVTIIDPDPMSGATHHAGGMLAPTAEVQYQQQELVPLMRESARLYPSLIRRVEQCTDLPTGYRTEGTLLIGADRADAQHVSDFIQYVKEEGIHCEALTSSQARRVEPALSPRIAKTAAIDGDHQLDPRLFARALLDAVLGRGARLIRDTVSAVTGTESARKIELGTGNSIELQPHAAVVLAAGLGVAEISGWFEGHPPLQLRPVYGDVLRVRVPESLQPLTTKVIRGFVEDRPIYIIPRNDGTLTIGATSREDGPNPRAVAVYELLRDAIRVIPGIEETEFLEATCGARPGTPDDLPYIGKTNGGVIVSTGYFRHGILLAALGAHTAVALATGQDIPDSVQPCHPFRHAPRAEPAGQSKA